MSRRNDIYQELCRLMKLPDGPQYSFQLGQLHGYDEGQQHASFTPARLEEAISCNSSRWREQYAAGLGLGFALAREDVSKQK